MEGWYSSGLQSTLETCADRLRTYLDDVLVYNEKLSGLHERVHLVLEALRENHNNNGEQSRRSSVRKWQHQTKQSSITEGEANVYHLLFPLASARISAENLSCDVGTASDVKYDIELAGLHPEPMKAPHTLYVGSESSILSF